MYIQEVTIKNFRLFSDERTFKISDFNTPDGSNPGSGLNVFVGENGCGKTSLLDAIVLPILEYKADTVDIGDFYSPTSDINIQLLAKETFTYDGTIPRTSYTGKGFEFEAKVRAREARAYLSSTVVSDQRFIRADGETKPEDGKPDLRLKVNNPWKGSRFSENDIVYLDKNRLFQIRSGTYNTTRFDRIMEDYNYRHIKENSPIEDLDDDLAAKVFSFENEHLKKALDKFEELYGQTLSLNLINNYAPFTNAFFGVKRGTHQQIGIDDIGSGFEMIFSLLYSYYLSQQSGKKLIILIDEPELHLHPNIQGEFAKLLLEFSKDAQIFITTHSPLLVKQVMYSDLPLIKVLIKDGEAVKESAPDDAKLPYISSNEVNFIAFQLPTEEYHNELYEELKNTHAATLGIKAFDESYFQGTKSQAASYEWKGTPNQVSLHTYVRNQIHHRADCGVATLTDLEASIETMRSYL